MGGKERGNGRGKWEGAPIRDGEGDSALVVGG